MKKLVSILLALSIVTQGSVTFAQEKQEKEQAVNRESQKKGGEGQEEEASPLNEIEAPESINDPRAYIITGDQYTLTIGSKTYRKNAHAYKTQAAPLVINGRNYIPLRFAVENILGGTFTIDQKTGTVVVKKEDISLQMTLWNLGAYINGEQITLQASPVIKNGTTYIPAKILSDYFGYTVSYNSKTKQISITGKDQGENSKPTARFEFVQKDFYIQGQAIQAINTSYDSEGHSLKDKLWCVISNEKIEMTQDIEEYLTAVKPGEYKVGLKVKDQYGLWSDWFYQGICIYPNEAPKITSLEADSTSYSQGATINFKYEYINEDWESITNEKWTYRRAEEEPSKAVIGKPSTLFAEGDYIVTLELDDAFGNRSEVYETTVHITDEALSKELEYRFGRGKIGDIIDNYEDINYRDYEDAVIKSTSLVTGRMMMSDSPEQVMQEGILYRDSINGKGRLLMHHINNFSEYALTYDTKRLAVVAENKTNKPVTLTLSNKAINGPTTDVMRLGQRVLSDYLTGKSSEIIQLKPGQKHYLYDSGKKWKNGTCISGLMDVMTTGEVEFTIAAISAGTTLNTISSLQSLSSDIHPRGTFEGIGINYTLDLEGSIPTKIVVGNGEEEWVKGYDAITHQFAMNKGNYGVSYKITLTAQVDMGVVLNPRADVFKGAVKWAGQGVYNAPNNNGAIMSNKSKGISLGVIRAGETKTLEYMLPNGSSAPVVLAFIPQSYWSE
ncbi:MAG: hypothetical protein E7231_02730 [Cellulosilyticum sp.]|nr:hypothetical protein [Cellulosilyticum sp.]